MRRADRPGVARAIHCQLQKILGKTGCEAV